MSKQLKLMAILAHPDDESLGMGATLARYAAEGVETYLVTATRGERGWFGEPSEYPGPKALGEIREHELYAAAEVLGLREVNFLDYYDGELDQADPDEVISRIVRHIRRIRPQVVVTFDPYGAYGHPDHIAISQFVAAAVVVAASPEDDSLGVPHQVSKLYYRAETKEKMDAYEKVFGDLIMNIDGVERRAHGWEPWAITTHLDTAEFWQQACQAIIHHRSQFPGYRALQELPEEQHLYLWATQTFYRVFSLVNGGRGIERDLFEGFHPELYSNKIVFCISETEERGEVLS